MGSEGIKVGRLAEKTGVSIRTLHYYDEIGLLSPSERTESGHRLYTDADVARLQQVMSLRDLGFRLDEINECLDDPDFTPYDVVRLHRARLKKQLEAKQRLYERLEALESYLRRAGEVPAEEFIQTIEGIAMVEQYYTPEQLEELKQRREALGEERIREAEQEWAALIEAAGKEMEKGTDPASEPVLELARRWQGLIAEFTGGNPEIAASLKKMYREEGTEKASRGMVNPELFGYMGKALEALNSGEKK